MTSTATCARTSPCRWREFLGGRLESIADPTKRPVEDVRTRHETLTRGLQKGESLEQATGGVIRYRAPGDASATGLPPQSVDVVFSNSVLEHVPGDVIDSCLAEGYRILRPGGVVFHSVNCGDHYAYVDRAHHTSSTTCATQMRTGSAGTTAFLYQNRLRAVDFIDMARNAGFAIELDTSRPHPTRLAQLADIPVHPRFARYGEAQLAITSIDFIGRRP